MFCTCINWFIFINMWMNNYCNLNNRNGLCYQSTLLYIYLSFTFPFFFKSIWLTPDCNIINIWIRINVTSNCIRHVWCEWWIIIEPEHESWLDINHDSTWTWSELTDDITKLRIKVQTNQIKKWCSASTMIIIIMKFRVRNLLCFLLMLSCINKHKFNQWTMK